MIKLGECELDYPAITRFKVYYKKKYMGEYDKAEASYERSEYKQ